MWCLGCARGQGQPCLGRSSASDLCQNTLIVTKPTCPQKPKKAAHSGPHRVQPTTFEGLGPAGPMGCVFPFSNGWAVGTLSKVGKPAVFDPFPFGTHTKGGKRHGLPPLARVRNRKEQINYRCCPENPAPSRPKPLAGGFQGPKRLKALLAGVVQAWQGRQATFPTETWMAVRPTGDVLTETWMAVRPTGDAKKNRNIPKRRAPKTHKSKRVGNRQAITSRAPKAPIPGNERDDWQPYTSGRASPPIEKGVPRHDGRRRRRPYSLIQYLSHRFAKEQPSIQKGKEVSRGGKP